jgi:hypothetical protein
MGLANTSSLTDTGARNRTAAESTESGVAFRVANTHRDGAGATKGTKLKYLPPFEVIKRQIEITTSDGRLNVKATYEDFLRMIQLLMSTVDVDEDWYLAQYADVAEAIACGAIESAAQHFIDNGYFEGRLPSAVSVDEEWYRKEYPDVAESIRTGSESSGQAHYVRTGYKEGRLPGLR